MNYNKYRDCCNVLILIVSLAVSAFRHIYSSVRVNTFQNKSAEHFNMRLQPVHISLQKQLVLSISKRERGDRLWFCAALHPSALGVDPAHRSYTEVFGRFSDGGIPLLQQEPAGKKRKIKCINKSIQHQLQLKSLLCYGRRILTVETERTIFVSGSNSVVFK